MTRTSLGTVIGPPRRAGSKRSQHKPYSSDADGFGVSEGTGVLVLERFSDARRHGHDMVAVLPGAAIGQDGASDGVSAPSEDGQRRVTRDALADAGLSPGRRRRSPRHGTKVRDPIEVRALVTTYGADPLLHKILRVHYV